MMEYWNDGMMEYWNGGMVEAEAFGQSPAIAGNRMLETRSNEIMA